jgi:macrolide-specific efflux system membrane fusion protein
MRQITGLVSRRRSGVFLALALALLGVYFGRERLFSSPAPKHLTARAARADLENVVLATGTLQPLREVDVGTRATGQLTSLKVKLGDHVRAGDLLAEIDPKLAESALKEAQARLIDLEAQKSAAIARLQKSLFDARREHGLIRGAATSAKEVQAADAQRKADEAGIASLDAQIVQAKSKIDTEATNLSYTKIFAPIDGDVVAILTKEGQTVVASQIVPVILKLAQLDVITVRSKVSEADIDSVEVGQTASFQMMSDRTGRRFGTIKEVGLVPQNYAETSGGAASGAGKNSNAGGGGDASTPIFFSATFDVPNPDHKLRAGKTVEVSIVVGAAKGALAIPTAALGEQRPDGRVVVEALAADGKPERRLIRVGVSGQALSEVLDGLKEGEEVVIGEKTPSPSNGS